MDLLSHFKNTIKEQRLINTNDHVLIAVSGGPDSVALLHLLLKIRHELGFKTSAAHINHGLRKSAKLDEKFVADFCDRFNIKFFSKKVRISKTHEKSSIEEIAREQRFRALEKIAAQAKANIIALGHNQDDLAETVLMRIIRGTGHMGLRSIAPSRKINDTVFVRPLLNTRRKEIERYLKQHKLKYRTDPTNKQKKFFRNKIRLELMPLLEKKYNKNIKDTLCNLADTSTIDYDYLNASAGEKIKTFVNIHKKGQYVKIPLTKLQEQNPSMKRMFLRMAITHVAGDTRRLTLSHIQSVENMLRARSKSTSVNLPKETVIKKTPTSVIITKRI